MKINMIAIALLLTAAVVLVAGCSGDSGTGTTSQNPSVAADVSSGPHPTPLPGMPTHVTSLTAAQKSQAVNIAKGDSRVQDILNKPGFSILGDAAYYSSDPALEASIVITGTTTVNSDGSISTSGSYNVIVDLDHSKVVDVITIAPSTLPVQ